MPDDKLQSPLDEARSVQGEYWDSVIDPQNLEDEEEVAFNLLAEMEFYRTPSQEFAWSMMDNPVGKKILEIGCGLGVNAIIMGLSGAEVVGIDVAPRRLETVSEIVEVNEIEHISLLCASGEDLPFADESFDIVYANAVTIHMNKEKAIQEFYRVLKPGGKVILCEPMKYHPLVNLYRFTLAPREWRDITEYYNFKQLKQLGSHFKIWGHKEYYLLSFLAFYWEFADRNLPWFLKTLDWLIPVDEWIMDNIPWSRKLAWFTVFWAEK